jgi:hypothetical protein
VRADFFMPTFQQFFDVFKLFSTNIAWVSFTDANIVNYSQQLLNRF